MKEYLTQPQKTKDVYYMVYKWGISSTCAHDSAMAVNYTWNGEINKSYFLLFFSIICDKKRSKKHKVKN